MSLDELRKEIELTINKYNKCNKENAIKEFNIVNHFEIGYEGFALIKSISNTKLVNLKNAELGTL